MFERICLTNAQFIYCRNMYRSVLQVWLAGYTNRAIAGKRVCRLSLRGAEQVRGIHKSLSVGPTRIAPSPFNPTTKSKFTDRRTIHYTHSK
jgi:hypothetical protein